MSYSTKDDTVTIEGVGTFDIEREDRTGYPHALTLEPTDPELADVMVEIRYEDEPGFGDPRRESCNVGTMLCAHRHYELGDEQIDGDDHSFEATCLDCGGTGNERQDETVMAVDCENCQGEGAVELSPVQWAKQVRGARVVLPLGLIDHSGISMYVGGGAHPHDPGGWDSGQVGIVFDTPEGVRECIGKDATDEQIEKALRAEVEEYDTYLRGEVYFIRAEAPGFDDACGGYLGTEHAEEAAFSLMEDAIEAALRERTEREHWASRDVATV